MRVWMGLNAVLMGSVLGTFAGLGLHTWVEGATYNGCTRKSGLGIRGDGCYATAPSSTTLYVVVGIAAGIALISAATWWLLRPSTKG